MPANHFVRRELVHQDADRPDDFEVRPLVARADAVRLPDSPLHGDSQKRAHVILDVQPIAHIAAVTVNRKAGTAQRVDDHQRDQLLGKMIGAIVVRAVADERR